MKMWRLRVKWLSHFCWNKGGKWLLNPLRSRRTWRYHREIDYKAFMSRKETPEYQVWIAEERQKLEAWAVAQSDDDKFGATADIRPEAERQSLTA